MTPPTPSSGTASAERKVLNFEGSFKISRFDRRIAVDDRLPVLRHPAGKSVADRNAQRREQTVVVAVHIFGNQFVFALDVDGDGVVGHHRLELDGEYRKRFAETERSTQILAQFEQRLRFLPSGGDGGQERGLASGVILNGGVFESGGRLQTALDFDGGGQRAVGIGRRLGYGQAFEMLVALLQNVDHFGIERLARFRGEFLHDVFQRQGAAVLTIRSKSVEIVDGRQDACSDGNFCALQVPEDSRSRPTFRGGRARWAPPDRGSARVPEFRRRPACESSSSRILPA